MRSLLAMTVDGTICKLTMVVSRKVGMDAAGPT